MRRKERPGKDPPPGGLKVGIFKRFTRKCAADGLETSLRALKDSSDAFPPLKSVVGSVIAIYDVAQRVKRSKRTAKDLADRAVQVLELLADNVPDPTVISPKMLASISQFEAVLNELHSALERLPQRHIKGLLHLNRNEGNLENFKQRLNYAHQAFVIGSTMRIECKVTKIQREIAAARADIEKSSRVVLKAQCEVAAARADIEKSSRVVLKVQVTCTIILFKMPSIPH